MPLLSVLIPTYNRPQLLREALISVSSSLGSDLEIIVGNNGAVDPVRDLLAELSLPNCTRLIENPEGSTYPYNISTLVASAKGKWLTILHDDDFFLPSVNTVISVLSELEDIDFLFSDHYLVDSSGRILEEKSVQNSLHYGRSNLQQGRVENLQLLAVENTICMDCFFVRTRLAQACHLDTSLRYFADVLFLHQVAALAKNAMYISDRLFVYRLNDGLTTAGLLQDELLFVLRRCRGYLTDPCASKALQRRIRRQSWSAVKYCLKKRRLKSLPVALSSLINFN